MNLTVGDLLQSSVALLGFSIFFIPPGYLLASFTNLAEFRSLSFPERLLWSISLSIPLAILLAVETGRHLSSTVSNVILYAICGAFASLLITQVVRGEFSQSRHFDRPARLAAFAMLGLAIYCLLATVGIQVHHRLLESVATGDWSVRVPLVREAIQDRVPPLNPFYGIDGERANLRYYYYWYVLCGQLGRIFHVTPRAILTASAAWSGFGLFSVLFLSFKYLFRPDNLECTTSARRLCLLSIPVSCILGLDIIFAFIGLFLHPVRVFPEMEWWRGVSDFAMSFHTSILYAPHHTAGFVACWTGFLLLTLCTVGSTRTRSGWPKLIAYGLIAGCCFAAATGTSTYITFFFVIVCSCLLVERVAMRDWRAVCAISLAGLVAIALSTSYIREIAASAGTSVGDGTRTWHSGRFLGLYLRDWNFAHFVFHLLYPNNKFVELPHILYVLLRLPIWIASLIIELGFFGFVLAYRTKKDWVNRHKLTSAQRFQWILCASFGFCALFITSATLIGINDLGRHAGFALRFVAVLWATPLIASALWSGRPLPAQRPLLRKIVLATIVIGLATQLWQVVIQRTYFKLVDSGYLIARPPFPTFRNIGSRYFDTRLAFDEIDKKLPVDSIIQFNPLTSYQSLLAIYLNRPTAASDYECMTPFGGNASKCYAAMPVIQALFGGSNVYEHVIPFDPERVTPESFDLICQQHHLTAIIATASDRVWLEKSSWVWTKPLIYGNSTIRVLACR